MNATITLDVTFQNCTITARVSGPANEMHATRLTSALISAACEACDSDFHPSDLLEVSSVMAGIAKALDRRISSRLTTQTIQVSGPQIASLEISRDRWL